MYLTGSTTYAYTVQAFDAALNYSGQSAPAAMMTLPVPPSPSPTLSPVSGGGGSANSGNLFVISGVQVVPDISQADVSFETNMPAQAEISWGKTPDYETGSLSALIYGTSHELMVTGLDADTTYYIRIQATNAYGISVTENTAFTTASSQAIGPLPNPSDFNAAVIGTRCAPVMDEP